MRYEEEYYTVSVSVTRLEHFVCVFFLPLSHFLLPLIMQLLSKPKFSSVEKIKTIGSTYMAAAGLTQSPQGDERKVGSFSQKQSDFFLFFIGSYKMF